MPTMLWIWGFLALFAHSVVSYTNGKCGPPTRYPDKHLLEKYEGRQEFNDGDKVTYKCALGYTGQGLRVSSCNNGAWSRLDFQCKRKRCGSAGELPNGRFRHMGNELEDLVYAECSDGYVLQGDSVRKCLADGWSGTVPRCVVADVATVTFATGVVCPLLKNENATFHGAKAAYNPGETLSYSCNAGFQLNGNNSILQCGRTGQWIPSHTNCHKIKCERFTIPDGKVRFGHLTYNTRVSIYCKDGFHLKGPSHVTCGGQGVWIPAPPTCVKVMPVQVTCPPPAVPNSSGQDGYKAEYEVGERAAISCQKGYRLIGSSQITCLEDGQWEELPNCHLIEGRCPPPPYVPNAHTEHNDQTHYKPNTILRFKCNHGYRMARGPSTISCRDGQWTDVQLMCEKKRCGSAGEVENGRYHYTGNLFGDMATARCNTGYQLVGKAVRLCRANGWDGRAPVCEAIQCPEPPSVLGADLIYDLSEIIKYGYVASYRCHFGTLIGESDIVCTEQGTWSPPAPRCEVTCPPLNLWYGVIVSGMRPRYPSGSSVAFRCNPGRRLSGPKVITCVHLVAPSKECPPLSTDDKATYNITKDTYTDKETVSYVCNVGFRLKGRKSKLLCVNGTWKPKSAECKLIKCEKLTIPNASLNTGHRRFNTQVNISCQEGYNIKGPNVITCGGQGVWIPAPPTCVKVMPVQVTCPPPAVPNSSGQDGYKAEYEVGERAAISCQKGYRLIGSSQITCLEDGQWEELPKCHLVEGRCPPPPYVPNAHTEHNDQTDYEPNTTLRLKCNLGYRIARGPSTISCRDGQWTDVQLMCEKKRCGSAGEVENGRYHYTGSSFGDMATARCFEGYQLIGVGVRHCTNNGWDGRVAVCEANQCPDPPEVPDADVYLGTSGIIKPGYVASYSCRLGTLIGESEIVCTEDGTWSHEAPRCKVVSCPAPNIQSGFIFSGVRRQYNSGILVTIKCNPGWRLFGSSVIKCGADGEWRPRLPKCSSSQGGRY
ncbi:hypothetical protein HF521_006390 [Silurus meridionalis]|uniref:Sushi domain-containing protein n=1 Tax=Silurus meridionalis TaxID=175797 RepID=A0A8T0AW55_SILME|nr:hypothetical protein HF521_006390 [Silurus meridionalis]